MQPQSGIHTRQKTSKRWKLSNRQQPDLWQETIATSAVSLPQPRAFHGKPSNTKDSKPMPLWCSVLRCTGGYIPAFSHIQLSATATRGHQYKYIVQYCRTNTYKETFFPSSIRRQKNWLTLNARQGFQPPHSPRLQGVFILFYTGFSQSLATRLMYIVLINSATMLDSPVLHGKNKIWPDIYQRIQNWHWRR